MQNWERNGWKVVTGCLKTLTLTKDVKWSSFLKTNWIRIYEKIVLQRQPSVFWGGGWERSIPLSLSLKRRAEMCALLCTPRSSGGTVESIWHTPKESKPGGSAVKRRWQVLDETSGGQTTAAPSQFMTAGMHWLWQMSESQPAACENTREDSLERQGWADWWGADEGTENAPSESQMTHTLEGVARGSQQVSLKNLTKSPWEGEPYWNPQWHLTAASAKKRPSWLLSDPSFQNFKLTASI